MVSLLQGRTMDAKTFWDKIKQSISERGKTFVWLCDQAGVSVQIMKNRIYKERIPDVEDTLKLLSVLGTTVEAFFYGDNQDKKNFDDTFASKAAEDGLFEGKNYGDSMIPTLYDGDTVFYDDYGYQEDGLYVIQLEGKSLVRRIQNDLGGVKILSDNPSYETLSVKKGATELKIIGKIHHAIHHVYF